eukprot:XP_017445307.1 PREDICTED: uncharacterized protein LOC108348301 isoform X1 [Rattus norvegicus]
MAKGTTSKCNHSLTLSLLVLLRSLGTMQVDGSTIKAPDTTQPTSTTQSPSTGTSTPAMSSTQSPSTGNSTQPTSTTDYLIIFEFTAIFLALIFVAMKKKRCSLLLPFLFSMNFSPHHQLYWRNLEHISVASPAKENISHDISKNLAADFEPDW